MSERIKLSFKEKVKREIRWLREDLGELKARIPAKYSDISGFAVVLMGYFFILDERGMKYPEMTILGSILGAWIGVEAAILTAKALGKHKR